MTKFVLMFLALVFVASTAHADDPAPPNSIIIIACRAEVQVEFDAITRPIPGKRYYQLYTNDQQEYECQRVPLENLEEKASFQGKVIPLEPNWSDYMQCAHVSMHQAAEWDAKHPGWLTVAVGCPTPITVDGRITGWHMPECPDFQPGTTNRMKCRYSKSQV